MAKRGLGGNWEPRSRGTGVTTDGVPGMRQKTQDMIDARKPEADAGFNRGFIHFADFFIFK